LRVFISWSKAKSRECALKLKELLEYANPAIRAFVSETDIAPGEGAQKKIISNIEDCDVIALCLTKENKKSPWLFYEAGFASGLNKTVVPILFDTNPMWHSWIDNPINESREINISGKDFLDNMLIAFKLDDTRKNVSAIEKFKEDIHEINDKLRLVDIECEDLIEKLVNEECFAFESPFYKNKTAYFMSGFESQELYKAISSSFMESGKYLWIYGRKNMKLLTGQHRLFRYLADNVSNEHQGMAGIDFRCLFLDPSSEEVEYAHIKPSLLRSELNSNIERALDIVNSNPALSGSFRKYSGKRDEIIIRLDNAIIYSRPIFDHNGRPQILTNIGFEVFGADSEKGKRCIKKFQEVWESSASLKNH